MMLTLRSFGLMVLIVMMSACGLLAKPDPVTTIALPIADLPEIPTWPANLAPGRVTPAAALNTSTVLASSGALLMQYEGLRWAAPPAQLLQEQLARLAASHTGAATPTASVRIVLSNVEWRTESDEALWRAHGLVACTGGETFNTGEFAKTHPANSRDPQAVAMAFQLAGRDLVAALIAEASKVAARCGQPQV